MTMKEAEESEYYFTGTTWDTWKDKPEYIEKRKAEAREIKKRLAGADFKIVRGKKSDWLGRSTSYAIMGNEIFNTFGDELTQGTVAQRITRYNSERAEIEARYKKELEELEIKHNADLDFIKEYQKLLK